MPSFSRESSRRSGLSSGWGDSDESSADEFSRKASKKISRGALSTKSSHWGDTDESSDDSKVRRIYSKNPSRQPSKLSSWGDSGTSSDSDAPAYGGAVKPKPISARASAREKSTLSRASKWSDEESDEDEHFSKKSKSKKISSVSKWSDDQSEASIKSPQPSKKSPESSKKEPEPARKSLDELMSKISYGDSRNEPSRKTSNMSKRPVSLRAPDKAPPKSPPKANQESEEKRETSIKKIEKLLEKKPVLPTPKSESSNDSDKEPFVLDSTNSERKQESSEDNQSRSSRVKGSRLSKISRISQWSDEDSDEEEPPKRVAPGRMNKLSSIDSNSNQNLVNPFMNPFDATVAHKESPPPAIPKSAVPMSSGTDWTDTEAKLTKEEEAIPAKYLMTTDNIESDPDEYVKQFNSKAINADNDFGPINDDTSLIDVDMELPPKQMVEIVPKKKGLCGASCSGRSNKSVWESIKSATKICKK